MKSTGVLVYRCTGLQVYWSTGVLVYRSMLQKKQLQFEMAELAQKAL